ncbi:DHH family phosphoesterase [Ammoniphilus resinae]|uniref:Phosphoesterase RecJ-like protein n=1 Tax=Ammoniphilus resinae TaxID=861532 RepID=A0ABS4GMN3_9BACL|nr:bifunctional oligoribonuclease/PAP phosphatase NrnA [Ammoniphilus resinae]MBP1931535.1 phosphoesterase RecJ-like protein [Ammoniphilus resinae]
MSYKEQLSIAGRFLTENDHFLVLNHVSPDGDATGSLLAMGHLLQTLGKTFTLANEGQTPRKLLFLPLSESILDLSTQELPPFSTVIALDCGDFKRIGDASRFIMENAQILNIDHHPTNDFFGTVNIVQTEACSTAEILFDLVKQMDIPLTEELAKPLYMGFLTDTGGFRYSNTTAEVMSKAAELLSCGVSPSDMAERCLETISKTYVQLLRLVLETIDVSFSGKVATLSATLDTIKEVDADSDDLDGLVNYARNIEGVEVGILFKEKDENTIKVSLRSKHQVDVGKIAKELGGGGHVRAAGCTINASLKEAKQMIYEILKQAMGEHDEHSN